MSTMWRSGGHGGGEASSVYTNWRHWFDGETWRNTCLNHGKPTEEGEDDCCDVCWHEKNDDDDDDDEDDDDDSDENMAEMLWRQRTGEPWRDGLDRTSGGSFDVAVTESQECKLEDDSEWQRERIMSADRTRKRVIAGGLS